MNPVRDILKCEGHSDNEKCMKKSLANAVKHTCEQEDHSYF